MQRDEVSTKILIAAGLAVAFALTLNAAAPAQRRHHDDRAITAPAQVTDKTFTVGATPLITVDNITGPIQVTGDGGTSVRMETREIISGDSDDAIAQARRDVHLDINQTAEGVKFYVDGPFRCGDNPNMGCEHWSDPGYEVRYEFELHVPSGAQLDLRTVNGGAIGADGVAGGFHVANVNGGVDLEEMSGSGYAHTVNGTVKVGFRSNPRADCDFGSINGSINLFFQPGLNANVRYKTLNGQVYSDFEVATMPSPAEAEESRDGMRVFRNGSSSRGRIGAGGPEITVNGLNGNIYLHRR